MCHLWYSLNHTRILLSHSFKDLGVGLLTLSIHPLLCYTGSSLHRTGALFHSISTKLWFQFKIVTSFMKIDFLFSQIPTKNHHVSPKFQNVDFFSFRSLTLPLLKHDLFLVKIASPFPIIMAPNQDSRMSIFSLLDH